jgi:hypothetical protein
VEFTTACRPVSAPKASNPNVLHTSAYPPRNAAIDSRRWGTRAEARAYSCTSGRLDGSIIATIISCQASRNASAATAGGGPPAASSVS